MDSRFRENDNIRGAPKCESWAIVLERRFAVDMPDVYLEDLENQSSGAESQPVKSWTLREKRGQSLLITMMAFCREIIKRL